MQFLRPVYCLLMISVIVAVDSKADAALVLTGAQIYSAADNADGSNSADTSYRYTTNSADTGGFGLSINGDLDKAISIPLSLGDNFFTFQWLVGSVNPGTFVGLNLFFTDNDGTPDNSFSPGFGDPIAGDLTVFKQVGTDANNFATVASGLFIQTYAIANTLAIANGKHSFILGDQMVSVTSFSSDSSPSGSFTLTVSAVPEPSSLALVSIVIAGIGLQQRRRNRN